MSAFKLCENVSGENMTVSVELVGGGGDEGISCNSKSLVF